MYYPDTKDRTKKGKQGIQTKISLGQQHQFNGHEFTQTPGDTEGQGSLARHSPWGHRELDMT